ncbi:ABC transporter permease [Acidovorax sp. Root402]|uniref:ABC transporter permease n=1 Tax=Acidovorax sp. Root402 TaxID=1736527 RepID=UPI0006F47C09|nr:ABC transporter permease [Acidovorax sp. Root402]KQW29988.1 ABC transporter permease [Acidovorax sp. Root402]
MLEPTAISTGVKRGRFSQEDRVWVSAGLYLSIALTLGLPLFLVFLWSVTERWAAPDLLPQSYTTSTWKAVLQDEGVLGAAVTSIFISLLVTFFTAAVALPTAWAMAKFPIRFKRAVEIFILAPVIVPGIVVAIGIGQVFQMLGIAYTVPGVVMVQMVGTLPLMVRLLVASFEVLPDELIHAARSLGASPLRAVWHVALPLCVPGLLAGSLLSFVGSFEEFDKTFLVGAPVVQTLPVLLYHYLDPYSLQFPLAAVVTLILLAPVLLIFLLSGRIMRDDLMAAGMGKV